MKNHLLLAVLIPCTLFSCKDDDKEPDITSGLTVHIPLDGTAIELVTNTTGVIHDAEAAPDRHGVSAKSMQFYLFDSSYIDFGDLVGASFPGNKFTIACWVIATGTTSGRAVLSKRTPTGPFEYSLDNHFNHNVYNLDNWISNGGGTVYGTDPLSASAHITPGTWQHIAYVADGESLKVYLDGVLQSGTDLHNSGASFSDTEAPFIVGSGGAYGVNHYFNGCVDEIRMYSRALSEAEVRLVMEVE